MNNSYRQLPYISHDIYVHRGLEESTMGNSQSVTLTHLPMLHSHMSAIHRTHWTSVHPLLPVPFLHWMHDPVFVHTTFLIWTLPHVILHEAKIISFSVLGHNWLWLCFLFSSLLPFRFDTSPGCWLLHSILVLSVYIVKTRDLQPMGCLFLTHPHVHSILLLWRALGLHPK
jgi:hypothetical protein